MTNLKKYVLISNGRKVKYVNQFSDLASKEKRSAVYNFGYDFFGGYKFGWKRSNADFTGFNFDLSDIEV